MSVFFKIAWRNSVRNRRRSLITISAISLGLASLVFLWSFQRGIRYQMIHNITSMFTGDIQIHRQGAEGLYNTNVMIEDPEAVRKILGTRPEIQVAAERVVGGGIVASAEKSMTTFIVGEVPALEIKMATADRIREGRYLRDDDTTGAVLGYKLARQLDIGIGDKVVLYSQDYFGGMAAEMFRVVGTFETGSDQVDFTTVAILLGSAQRMLSLENRITKFVIRLVNPELTDQVIAGLRPELEPGGLTVVPWQDVLPMMYQMLQFQRTMLLIVLTIVLIIVGTGILNTLMMSVTQRIREFGLMASLGSRPAQIARTVVLESLVLGLAGAAVGLTVGFSLALWFGHRGIDLQYFTQAFSNLMVGSVIYPRVDWLGIVISLAIVLFCTVAASLIPALKAARLEPIEAMRHVG